MTISNCLQTKITKKYGAVLCIHSYSLSVEQMIFDFFSICNYRYKQSFSVADFDFYYFVIPDIISLSVEQNLIFDFLLFCNSRYKQSFSGENFDFLFCNYRYKQSFSGADVDFYFVIPDHSVEQTLIFYFLIIL